MILLDTHVISELSKPNLDGNVGRWFEANLTADIYLCDIVIMEQSFGAERFFLRNGSDKHLRQLAETLKRFESRILAFTHSDALSAGRLRARRERVGRPIGVQDAMIAAICLAHGATLATRNVKDFEGLDLRLVNPFEGA